MKYAAFIAPAYAVGVLLPLFLAASAALRLASAKRRLAAIERRRRG